MEQHLNPSNVRVPQVKVLIQAGDTTLDLNKQGLVTLRFQRYLNDPQNRGSNILTELDLTTFDTSGYELLSAIQNAQGQLFISYGFDYNMSPIYRITPTRYNVVQNHRGIMLGLGGFGTQNLAQYGAEAFKEGTRIKDIIVYLAKRNGWSTGNTYNSDGTPKHEFINVLGHLPNLVYKEVGTEDFDFIKGTLLPIADNTTFFDETGKLITGYKGFYQVILQDNGGILELHVLPLNKTPTIKRNEWLYTYGIDTNSQIIDMTNQINYDWIINGITLDVPVTIESLVKTDKQLEQEYATVFERYSDTIKTIFREHDLTLPEHRDLTYRFRFYEVNEEDYREPDDIIVEKLQDIVNTFNTMELTVVGNPMIMATDRINLVAKNKDGHNMIQNGLWRITAIEEVIGLSGYQTKLTLVRDKVFEVKSIKEVEDVEK